MRSLSIWIAVFGCISCTPPAPSLEPLVVPEGCQPLLVGQDCLLPYPSDFFRVADATTPTGFRIELSGAAKPITLAGYSADVNDWRKTDGFSPTPPIVTLLNGIPGRDGLVGIFADYEEAAQAESRTLLLDTVTGEWVPHFVDLDDHADDETRRALIIRPMRRLAEQRRYVVAIQGVTDESGALLPPAEGFRRLRDAQTSQDPTLDALATRYAAEIFGPLAEAGVAQQNLQLAWDFTTGAESWAIDDMFQARALALADLAENPPVVTISEVREVNDGTVWRRITGTIEGPKVTETQEAGSALARDDDGKVRLEGRASFPFTAVIPECVKNRFQPGLVLEYGHGFFGTRGEVDSASIESIFDASCAVGFGIDWWGMSTTDVGILIGAFSEQVWRAPEFGERIPQGMVNWLTLTAALDGALADEPGFRRPDDPAAAGVVTDPDQEDVTNAGALLFDAAHIDFLGISQGHILGGVYAALNPRLAHVGLHVGGAGFTHMMLRAMPFEPLFAVLSLSIDDPLEQQKLIATMQRPLDRIDPASYARFLLREPLPLGPAGGEGGRQVLMQTGLGDTSVPNFASFLHARLVGLSAIGPQSVPVYGIEEMTTLDMGSGFASFDLGFDTSFSAKATFPEENSPVHVGLRSKPEVLEQLSTFLREGRLVHPCEGPCVLP